MSGIKETKKQRRILCNTRQIWLNMAEESSVQQNCVCYPESNDFVTTYAKTYTFETNVTKVNQS